MTSLALAAVFVTSLLVQSQAQSAGGAGLTLDQLDELDQADRSVAVRGPPSRATPWVTYFHLQTMKLQQVVRDMTVPGPGRYELKDGVTATLQSPNYPGQYGPRTWVSWKFQTPVGRSSGRLHLTCDQYDLSPGDYLVLRYPALRRYVVDASQAAPDLYADQSMVLELRSSSSGRGKLRCSVRAMSPDAAATGGGGSGAGAAQVPAATQSPMEQTEKPTMATEKPTEATETPTPATERPTDATEKPTEATEAPSQSTDGWWLTATPSTTPQSTTPAAAATGGASGSEMGIGTRSCGKGKSSPKIVGGAAAARGAFPWLCALVSPRKSKSRKPFCGCSIINHKFILTAAHCVSRSRPSSQVVLVRKHTTTPDPQEIEMKVKSLMVHPDYSSRTLDSDLALLELKESLQPLFDNPDGAVQPVCLPTKKCGGRDSDACWLDRTAVLAGWGVLKSGVSSRPDVVHYVHVPVVDNTKCYQNYQNLDRPIIITDNMICAGLEQGGKDTCQGDSGGPMMMRTEDDVHILSGVVSFGRGCAEKDFPGVYTRISEFLPWIEENAKA